MKRNLYPRQLAVQLCLFLGLFLSIFGATNSLAQVGTPTYFSSVPTTATNLFPLNSATSNKVQWIYAPNVFSTAGGGAGTLVGAGNNITKLYIRIQTPNAATVYSPNFEISMTQSGTSNVFSSGTYLTGLTSVFQSAAFQFTGVTTGSWYGITLTTPFPYNPAQSLIIEVKSNLAAAGGNSVNSIINTGLNQRIYGSYAATTGTATTGTTPMGFDVVSAVACTAPPTPGTATATPSSGICAGTNISLDLTGNSIGSGQTYQWQTGPTSAGPFTNFGSSQTSSFLSTPATITQYYRCVVTCSGNSQNSLPALVTVNPAFPGGTYTINSAVATGGTNFQTFTAFKNALLCGISGAIVANVVAGSGPYNEQVEFPQIVGASSVNTITINGNGNTLTFAASVSTAPGTLILNGTDYMTVNNLIVEGTGATYALVCHLWNQADNNAFNNCTFNAPANGTSTTQVPFSISGSATSGTTAGVSGSNNIITGCTMFSGYYNTCIVGNSSANSVGNQVVNCNIRDQYFYGIYIYYQTGAIIRGNTLERTTRTTLSTYYGIYVLTGCTNMIVDGNRIRKTWDAVPASTGTQYSIYSSIDASAGNENVYTNNLISDINFNGTIYGMYMTGADYWKAYHNTISLDQTAATGTTTTYGVYATGTLAYDVRDNIITIARGGTGTKYCVYYSTPAAATSNYNDLYINAAGGVNNIGYNGVAYSTLPLWQSNSGKDANSISTDPLYAAPGSNDYTPANGLVNDVATPVGVTTDINGAARSLTTPDMGAYEFSLGGLDAGISWVSPTSPASGGLNTITVNISNTQAQTIVSLDLSYNDGSGPVTESFTGLNIPSGSNQNISFTTQYNLTGAVSITASIISVNGGTDAVSGNNTVTYALCATLAPGTYTINSGAATGGTNFQTFNAAITAMNCGITGPMIFNVVAGSGPYNEQVTINPIPGTSSVNTITFNGNGRTLTYGATLAASPHTFALNGADYINVNNLVIEGTGTTYALVCHLWNGADNNTFTNCTFNAPANGSSTTQVPFSISGSATTATTSGVSGINNVITGCTMFSGYYNTCLVGNSASPATGNQVINCNIRDQYLYGLYNLYQNGAILRGNILERTTRTTLSTYYGIYVSTGCTNMLVEKNKIRKTWETTPASTGTQYTIYCTIDASVGNENKFINNLVSDINFNGTIYGMYMSGSDYWQAYHNTISLDQTSSTATATTYGIYATGTVAYDARNNNISIKRGGTGIKYGVYYSTIAAATSNYNNIYVNSAAGTNYIGYDGVSTYATLALWQGTGKDLNSVSADPLYFNPAAGNYKPTEALLDNVGTGLGILTDITGAVRSPSSPDPGAYEFTVAAKDIGVFAFVSPAPTGCYTNAETIVVTLRNYGTQVLNFAVDPVTVNCVITGQVNTTVSATLTSGTLAVGGTTNVSLSPTVDGTANGTYSLNATTVMAADGEPANDAYPQIDITVGPVAGTVSSTLNNACITGSPVLTASGVFGGAVQWQESTTGAGGPWTNVGTNSTTYTPGAVTQTTWYQAQTVCNTNSTASNTVNVTIANPALLSSSGNTRCGVGTVNLSATPDAGYVAKWYDSPSSQTALYTGNTFTTPVITTTTDYYVAASDGGSTTNFGLLNRVGSTTNSGYSDIGLAFDASQAFTLVSVAIYPVATTPSGNVTATIALKNSAGTILQSTVVSVPTSVSPGIKTTVPLNFLVPVGTQHRLVFTAASGGGITGFIREVTTGYTYPYILPGVASITSAYTGGASSAYYYYFYDWLVSTGCEGTRTMVTATVTTPPAINIVPTDPAVCPASSTTISVNSVNDPDYTYAWTANPAGFTASGAGPHTISPTVSTYYIVTATDNTAGPNAGCVARDSALVQTGAILAGGTVTASQTSLCVSGAPTLTVAGSDGGAIQWQSSTVSASGPWTNVGTNSTIYNPGTVTQTTYYKVVVSCQTSSVSSNVETLTVNNPQITGTTPQTRCGVGSVTLQATASGGATLNWYNSPAGGAPIWTGASFPTPVIASTTTYYVAANSGGGTGGTPIAITEFDLGTNDQLEIQNISPAAVDVTGWRVAVSNSYTVFNSVNANIQVLSGTLAPGAILTWTDNAAGPNYWGSNILWNPGAGPTYTGWAIIIDNSGNIVDFAALNWPAATIASTSLTVGPYTVNPGTKWTGDGVDQTNVLATQSVSRQGTSDNNTLADWAIINLSMGTINTGMTIPFTGFGCEGTRVPVVATVTTPPSISVTPTQTTCSNVSKTLAATSPNDPDYTYVWNPGNLTGSSITVNPITTTTYTVTATDNTTGPNAGCANVGTVLVNVNPAPAAPTITPTSSLLCEDDTVKLKASGSSTINTVTVGTGVVQNTSTTYPAPYGDYYTGVRTQMLIRASELTALGLSAGNLTSLSFDVVNTNATLPLQGFTISIGNTALTALTTAFQSGLTQVYTTTSYAPVTGWNPHPFSTPFYWNGTSNIIVETYFSNCLPINCSGTTCSTYGSGTTYLANCTMNQSATAFASCAYYNSDAASCAINTVLTASAAVSQRPNMRIVGGTDLSYVWTPPTDLFNDSLLTSPYVPGSFKDSVYAHPSITRTYTATATLGSCPSSTDVTVTIDVIPQVTITPSGPTSYCPGSTVTLNSNTDPTYTNYAWTPGGPSGSAATSYTVGGATNTTTVYRVTATGAGGCTSHQDISVHVHDTVPPTITVIGSTNLCTGQTTSDLQADIFGATGPAATYLWSTTETTSLITVSSGGTYSLVTSDVHGCFTHQQQVITESAAPAAPIVTPAGPINLCSSDGGMTYSSATLTCTNYSSDLLWSTSETTQSIVVDYGDIFNAIYTDPNGCYSVSNTVVTNALLASADPASVSSDITTNISNNICLGNSVILTVNGGSLGDGADWYWYEGTGACGTGTARGNGSSVTITPSTTGVHHYMVRAEGTCGPSNCASIDITVSTAPPTNTIHAVAAPTVGCNGSVALMSVNAVANATFYSWNGTSGALYSNNIGGPFVAGPYQTTAPQVYIQFLNPAPAGNSGYSICAFAGNACGQSNTICKWVRSKVSQPGVISGSNIGCPNTNGTYSVAPVIGADTYTWTVSGNAGINGGGTTLTTASNSITVNFGAGYTSGTLSVIASLNCGFNSSPRTISISNTPAQPGAMSGPTFVCPGSSASFSVPAVTGAASYNWTCSVAGAVITPSGNSCSILFPAAIPAGSTVCVSAVSSCGNASTLRCKGVANGIPGTPGNISGPTAGQCGQSGVSYSVLPVSQATGYIWTVNNGATISGPNNLSSVSVNFPTTFTTCTLTVAATNGCGTGLTRTLVVNGVSAQPGPITGNLSVCNGAIESYTTGGSAGATSYNWTSPAGSIILNTPPYGPSIFVQWGPTGGNVTVAAVNDCGTSPSRSLAVAVTCRQSQLSETLNPTASLYPNPTSGKTTVKFESAIAAKYVISVVDVTGRIIISDEVTAAEGINMHELDLTGVAKGIYLVRLETAGEQSQLLKVTVE